MFPLKSLNSSLAYLATCLMAFVSLGVVGGADVAVAQQVEGGKTPGKQGDERSRFLGTWKVVRTEFAGDGENPQLRTDDYFHFTDGEAVSWAEGYPTGKYYDKWDVDEKARPHRLNQYEKSLAENGEYVFSVYPAIYEWDGERLKIVLPNQAVAVANKAVVERQRPKVFGTSKNKPTEFYLWLERVKEKVEIPKRS